jgi:hypothetical protein
MGLSFATTIFLFIICLCGGIAIGVIFSRLRNPPSEIPPEKEDKELGKAVVLSVKDSQEERGEFGSLHAWVGNTGNTCLEMDGQRLENKHSLGDEQKKKLMKLVLKLRSFLDEPAVPATTPTALPRKLIFGKPKVTASGTPATIIQPKSGSIVEQIESILQRKLPGTLLEGKNIHILEGQAGEVIVQIDQERFIGVNAVTDADIKDLIRKAVVEWEIGSK